MLAPRLAALVACSSVVLACSDPAARSSASAAPSASAEKPKPCAEVALAEQDRRCVGGESLCCSFVFAQADEKSPSYLDEAAKTCAGGHERACQVVRDADRAAAWKVDALDRACTRMGRWTCRVAAQLALVAVPDRSEQVFDNFCRQTDDRELRFAGRSFKCPKLDAATLAELAPDAAACTKGEVAACRTLAAEDGNVRPVLQALAWAARGVPPAEAESAFRARADLLAGEPKARGRVTPKVLDAGALEEKAVAAALVEAKKRLAVCLGSALEADATLSGEVELELVVDRTGRVAYAKPSPTDLRDDLVACAQHVLQDTPIGEPRAAPARVKVRVAFAL